MHVVLPDKFNLAVEDNKEVGICPSLLVQAAIGVFLDHLANSKQTDSDHSFDLFEERIYFLQGCLSSLQPFIRLCRFFEDGDCLDELYGLDGELRIDDTYVLCFDQRVELSLQVWTGVPVITRIGSLYRVVLGLVQSRVQGEILSCDLLL